MTTAEELNRLYKTAVKERAARTVSTIILSCRAKALEGDRSAGFTTSDLPGPVREEIVTGLIREGFVVSEGPRDIEVSW